MGGGGGCVSVMATRSVSGQLWSCGEVGSRRRWSGLAPVTTNATAMRPSGWSGRDGSGCRSCHRPVPLNVSWCSRHIPTTMCWRWGAYWPGWPNATLNWRSCMPPTARARTRAARPLSRLVWPSDESVNRRPRWSPSGTPAPSGHCWHLPDAALDTHEGELAQRLDAHLVERRCSCAPWAGDGHPDHEAAGRAARRAVDRLIEVHHWAGGASKPPALWEYPVWAWHWATPTDRRLPLDRARTVRLHPREQAAKAAAVACFASQLYPLSAHPSDQAVLPPQVVAHFALGARNGVRVTGR